MDEAKNIIAEWFGDDDYYSNAIDSLLEFLNKRGYIIVKREEEDT